MKFISGKALRNEPEDFRQYRETTPNARYNGGNFNGQALRKALLDEQGYICAYCMGKLEKVEKAHVEHYCPQAACPDLDLDYFNLVAVCDGRSESYPDNIEFHHCDKTQGEHGKINGNVKLKKINPMTSNCESLITYNIQGEILTANEDDEDVRHDLNIVLNLNNSTLIQRRKAAMDRAVELMKTEQPVSRWKKIFIETHRDQWLLKYLKKGILAYRPYCMASVWLLQNLISKPKYQ
jgi:uncharacterized protein (TIGR02646 family)